MSLRLPASSHANTMPKSKWHQGYMCFFPRTRKLMMTFSDAIVENRRPEATLNFRGEDCFTSGTETLLFMKHEHAEYEMRGAELLRNAAACVDRL